MNRHHHHHHHHRLHTTRNPGIVGGADHVGHGHGHEHHLTDNTQHTSFLATRPDLFHQTHYVTTPSLTHSVGGVSQVTRDSVGGMSHVDHHLTHVHVDTMSDSDHTGHHSVMDDMGGMNHMHHSMTSNMRNTFGLSTESHFLLQGINISTVEGIILAMLFAMIITILYETLNNFLHVKEHKLAARIRNTSSTRGTILQCGILTLIRVASGSMAYLIMLVVMTMNIWLFISVIVGAGLAYFFIRPVVIPDFGANLSINNDDIVRETEPLNRYVAERADNKLRSTSNMLESARNSDKVDVEQAEPIESESRRFSR